MVRPSYICDYCRKEETRIILGEVFGGLAIKKGVIAPWINGKVILLREAIIGGVLVSQLQVMC